jgi:hypothetical protein
MDLSSKTKRCKFGLAEKLVHSRENIFLGKVLNGRTIKDQLK